MTRMSFFAPRKAPREIAFKSRGPTVYSEIASHPRNWHDDKQLRDLVIQRNIQRKQFDGFVENVRTTHMSAVFGARDG